MSEEVLEQIIISKSEPHKDESNFKENNNIKWLICKLCIEFEKYDELKSECDEVEENLEEFDDDLELDREERNKKKELKILKKKLLCSISKLESMLIYKWNALKNKISDDEYMKKISGGDSYFMSCVFRVRKEIQSLIDE